MDYGNHSESESFSEPASEALSVGVDDRRTDQGHQENKNNDTDILQRETGAANTLENHDTAHLDILARRFYMYTEKSVCAQPNTSLTWDSDIPNYPKGNCLFFSLIKILGLSLTPIELRQKLLASPALRNCGSPHKVSDILSSPTEFADADCVYIFAQEYNKNICVHDHEEDKLTFLHYIVKNDPEFLHLHLIGYHSTPYLPTAMNSPDRLEQNIPLEEIDDEQLSSGPPIISGIMTHYLVSQYRHGH